MAYLHVWPTSGERVLDLVTAVGPIDPRVIDVDGLVVVGPATRQSVADR